MMMNTNDHTHTQSFHELVSPVAYSIYVLLLYLLDMTIAIFGDACMSVACFCMACVLKERYITK